MKLDEAELQKPKIRIWLMRLIQGHIMPVGNCYIDLRAGRESVEVLLPSSVYRNALYMKNLPEIVPVNIDNLADHVPDSTM